ncbi:MAG: hypothetical protein OSA97_06780 [Nevskia sp.]|nr:hypothetical protein [Nevskia sp.]
MTPAKSDCRPGPDRSAPHLIAAVVDGERSLRLERSLRIEFGDGTRRDALQPLSPEDCEQIAEAAAETARQLRREQQGNATLELEL